MEQTAGKAAQAIYRVAKNERIAHDVYAMRLEGPTEALQRPGQFINIKLDGHYLRRPISVCGWDGGGIDIIFKILGLGTAQMSGFAPGKTLDVLVGLGNGFDTAPARGKKTVLVGGGVGVPPLYGLAKALIASGEAPPAVALGFRAARDVFCVEGFEALGCEVAVATEDGSLGGKGFVTGPLAAMQYEYYFACGPNAMLKAVYRAAAEKGAGGQLSFEERMGCGFGACMGCSCKTKFGNKRVCVEGPVFDAEEVLLDG